VRALDTSLFTFQLYDMVDMDKILKRCHWTYDQSSRRTLVRSTRIGDYLERSLLWINGYDILISTQRRNISTTLLKSMKVISSTRTPIHLVLSMRPHPCLGWCW